MARVRMATVWLGGCSGCHMSFLDLDEWLLELAKLADIVYSPILDTKEFPEGVDVTLIEGAVANEENRHMLHKVRARSTRVIAFGDCAVTGNVTALRNPLQTALPVLLRSYVDNGDLHSGIPCEAGIVPVLTDRVVPIHAEVPIDLYLPGCPPPASRIKAALEQVLSGSFTPLSGEDIRFG